MDIKHIFPGGEPRISNPDLMRMQYSNYYGLQNFAASVGDGIINGCEITVDSISYTAPRVATLTIADGWCIVNGELVKVDEHQFTLSDIAANEPGGTYGVYISIEIESTYDPLGNKTFNDSTPRQTWEKRRGVFANARSTYAAGPNPTPTGMLDIATFGVTFATLPYNNTVTMLDDTFLEKSWAQEWINKLGSLGSTTTTNPTARVYGLVGSNAVPVQGPAVTDISLRSVDGYTKIIPLGTWNMTTGYTTSGTGVNKEITIESMGLPSGYKITEMHVTINLDNYVETYTNLYGTGKGGGKNACYYTSAGTPRIIIYNFDEFASSPSCSGTTTNRGYLTVKYIII